MAASLPFRIFSSTFSAKNLNNHIFLGKAYDQKVVLSTGSWFQVSEFFDNTNNIKSLQLNSSPLPKVVSLLSLFQLWPPPRPEAGESSLTLSSLHPPHLICHQVLPVLLPFLYFWSIPLFLTALAVLSWDYHHFLYHGPDQQNWPNLKERKKGNWTELQGLVGQYEKV